ncbi:hypothetical protein [Massilia sp. ST3]|uniref:hypothetical protein n=1 Tax=Massilia sp. ST3 TaxID=2824903 RepID=UPI001B844CE2|nr:hypothetical protein [Massilia sp. ST3]MBQ5947556.1 hypothetical protein [Massilia sp. ST3]
MAKLAAIVSTLRTHALLGCFAASMLAGCGGNDGARREHGLVTQTAAEVLDSKTVAAAPVAGAAAADEPDVNAPAVPVEAEAVAEQAPVQAAPAPAEQAPPAALELTAPAVGSNVAASGSARIFVAAGPGPDRI